MRRSSQRKSPNFPKPLNFFFNVIIFDTFRPCFFGDDMSLNKKETIIAAVLIVVVIVAVVFLVNTATSDADDEPSYTIQYVVEDETYTFAGAESTITLKSLAEIGAEIEDWQAFGGWKLAEGTLAVGTEVTLDADAITTVTAVITNVTYTVKFVDGDEVVETITGIYGDDITAPNAIEKEGYEFIGWGDVAETITGDATYTASWAKIVTVTEKAPTDNLTLCWAVVATLIAGLCTLVIVTKTDLLKRETK